MSSQPSHASQPSQSDQARIDSDFMRQAIALSQQGLGVTSPNPSVGAIVVRDGKIIGRGVTHQGGRPHAETEALRNAGDGARGATLYVSLEPCSHHGLTPPCAEAIVKAGIARVVSALDDPDARVAGRGHQCLRDAGIALTIGIGAQEARHTNLGHILRITQGRPMVTLKLAETLDGYAAGDQHDGRLMITGAASNEQVQILRAQHDAIMIGIGTALADDPLLTVRAKGYEDRRPLRVVLDTHLRLPTNARLSVTARDYPTLVIAGNAASHDKQKELESLGIAVERCDTTDSAHLDLLQALKLLGQRGNTRVLSEGGPQIARDLIAHHLADDILILTSAKPLGRAGLAALDAKSRQILQDPQRYVLRQSSQIGTDQAKTYERIL